MRIRSQKNPHSPYPGRYRIGNSLSHVITANLKMNSYLISRNKKDNKYITSKEITVIKRSFQHKIIKSHLKVAITQGFKMNQMSNMSWALLKNSLLGEILNIIYRHLRVQRMKPTSKNAMTDLVEFKVRIDHPFIRKMIKTHVRKKKIP